jgi:hypothetical protein
MKMKLTNTGLAIIALGKKATIQKTTKTLMERKVTMSNNNEGQYIVAGLHPRFGVVKLDTGKRYTLERAERRAGELNDTCEAECKAIGCSLFVAYNTEAEDMAPPYYVDVNKEWNFVLDDYRESLYIVSIKDEKDLENDNT